MSRPVAVEGNATLYDYFSIALLFPVIVWPFIYSLLSSSLEGWFYFGWIVSAGMVLLIAVVADSICYGSTSFRSITVSFIWIVLVVLFVSVSLSLGNSIYLMASLYFFYSLRSCLDLWFGRENWWSWTAWARDSLTALILFLWQLFLTLAYRESGSRFFGPFTFVFDWATVA